ncbi:hypothetical protein [Xylophilus sp. GOD-11R]|uniref:hypothetical protein n=1 Tax=Xylophilus sp. GOD-11R TaxID=3089814 RepID=UPI00298C32F3|nr:hypothetical protein [Xylophilus sp. GOD-11R]WPB57974.1 hypothetical protein R9X41_04825 [Xylophilus sp. GOD-11R]
MRLRRPESGGHQAVRSCASTLEIPMLNSSPASLPRGATVPIATRPAAAVTTTPPHAEPSRLEHLPPELLLDIGQFVLRDNAVTPSFNRLPEIGLLNHRLNTVFQMPAEATRLARRLWMAEDPKEFVAAVDGLQQVPPSECSACWDSVVPAMLRQIEGHDPSTVSCLVAQVVQRMPDNPAIRLRVLQQLTDRLLKRPEIFLGLFDRLIVACTAEPRIPEALWRQLLELMAKGPAHWNNESARSASAARLSPARRVEFELMRDIRQLELPWSISDLNDLYPIVRRIEALEPGPSVTILYRALISSWERSGTFDMEPGLSVIQASLLAAAEKPRYREEALSLLPRAHEPQPELLGVLQHHLGHLRPLAAMRLLTSQMLTFLTDLQCLPTQCADALQRARALPAEHAEATLELARNMPTLHGSHHRAELDAMLMAELPRLPLVHRLPVMREFVPAHYLDPVWRPERAGVWQQWVQQSCEAAMQDRADMPAREGIRMLAGVLCHEEWRDRVRLSEGPRTGPIRAALLHLLDGLPQQELFPALREALLAYGGDYHARGASLATVQQLLRCCARLPLEERTGLLRYFENATHGAPAEIRQLFTAFEKGLQEERGAWKSLYGTMPNHEA